MNRFNDNFYMISETGSESYVEDVSELRHYTNIYGITNELTSHFKTNYKTIEEIADGCFGSCSVKQMINNPEKRKEEIKNRINVEIARDEAIYNNQLRVETLKEKRETFCNIGTNKIKRRLNKLAVNNPIAKIYRLALEAEDKNILAKDASRFYADKIYFEKHKIITELISLFKENDLKFGKQPSDVRKTRNIIYFEIPNCKQISFHCDLDNNLEVPDYETEWDGINSFSKLI